MQIRVTPGSSVAIFRQIADQIRRAVVKGELEVGAGLPSVRALAKELVVNPNTVARAYGELTRDGVLEGQQGRGVFVARKRSVYSRAERARRLAEAIDRLIAEAMSLDYSDDEIIDHLRKRLEQTGTKQPEAKRS